MIIPWIAGALIAMAAQQLFMRPKQAKVPDQAPLKPVQQEEDADAPEQIKDPTDTAPIAKASKRASLGLNPESTTSDLKTPGISSGIPNPGGRKSPVGVQAP
jgi:hypothetical protein